MGPELVTTTPVLKTTSGLSAAPARAPAERQAALAAAAVSSSQHSDEQVLAERDRLALRLETLLGALPAGVVVLDAQGRVTQANPAAVELLGALAVGEAWFEVVRRAFAPRWDDGHDVSLVDGRRVNVATQALTHEPGQILLIKDVSETRRLQEQLSHHRRLSAKTEMAAALAHQIRTPLAAALLALGPLARFHGLPAPQRRAADRVLESLRQLDRLVENMLSFARGTLVDAQAISLATLLARLQLEAAPILAPGELQVECAAEHAALQIYGNADALLSSLLNLVANSRQIVGESCQLRVAVAALGEFVALRFIDNGPGVPPAERAHIFEPFHTTRRGGTGLGLSVAQAIARAHGGELGLDADYLGGACFEFSLPTYTQQHSAQVPA